MLGIISTQLMRITRKKYLKSIIDSLYMEDHVRKIYRLDKLLNKGDISKYEYKLIWLALNNKSLDYSLIKKK